MNLRAEDLASGVLRDRVKVGASLADVDPMNLDASVSICVISTVTKLKHTYFSSSSILT